jgi:molecular chaperone HscA
LSPEELKAIEEASARLEAVLQGADHRAIKQASDALNRATDEFAARRMDQGIRRALAGKQIGSL